MAEGKKFLTFLWMDGFADDWTDLNLNFEQDLWGLEILIMNDPEAGDVMRRTGGVRKIRYAPKSWNMGKSGAIRVCYAYLPSLRYVLMAMAFPKNQQVNLTVDEERALCKAVGHITDSLQSRMENKKNGKSKGKETRR